MLHDVIVRPIITEKSMQGAGSGKYSFVVQRFATKDEIKKAMKAAFNVNVVTVSTSVIKGKRKRVGERRIEVRETNIKKATIILKQGEKISLFESGTEEEKETKKKKKK